MLVFHRRLVCNRAFRTCRTACQRWLSVQEDRKVPNSNPELIDTTLSSKELLNDIQVFENFITANDEKCLLDEINPYLKRLRYEIDHWDSAIHNFRETEKANWNETNEAVIRKMQRLAFPTDAAVLRHVHVLDIAKEGFIKPHIDSVKFCGNTIVGICLLSDSVMRLVHEKNPAQSMKVFLPQLSLYLMRNVVRYEFTHEILKDSESYFKERHIPRDRRISIICRNEPTTST